MTEHNKNHSHCPDGCEHPQPIIIDSKEYCGRCLILFGEEVLMIPCDSEIC